MFLFSLTFTIGTVTYSGLAPNLVGLYQVNVQIGDSISPGDAVPLTLSIQGKISNTVSPGDAVTTLNAGARKENCSFRTGRRRLRLAEE